MASVQCLTRNWLTGFLATSMKEAIHRRMRVHLSIRHFHPLPMTAIPRTTAVLIDQT